MVMLRVERVTEVQELIALKDDWDRLVDRSLQPELYVAHDWVSLWCKYFVTKDELCVLLVWDGSCLLGIAPLIRTARSLKGVPVRQLGFMLNSCNVRGNVVLAPDRMKECLAAVLSYLRSIGKEWDLLSLYGMSEQSRVPETLADLLGSGDCTLPWLRISSWKNSFIALEEGWEAYLAGKSRHFRKNAKSARRTLDNVGAISFERYVSDEQVRSAFEEFLSIESRSWKVRDGESLSARADSQEFYRHVALRFAERGAWRQWMLRVDGRPVASIFGLIYDGTLYAEKTAYAEMPGHISFGSILFHFAIEDAFTERAAKEMDFDMQTDFSRRLQTGTRQYHHFEIFSGSLYSRALYSMKRLIRVWRGLRHRVEPVSTQA